MNRIFSYMMFLTLLLGLLGFYVSSVKSEGAIYIRPDGSIAPLNAPIHRNGSMYTLTEDIYGYIVVEKDNITICGNGYKLDGESENFFGLHLVERKDIIIRNISICNFKVGIYMEYSANNTLIDNRLEGNEEGITLHFSDYNNLVGNNLTNNVQGLTLFFSYKNTLTRNRMFHNKYSFFVGSARRLQFYENYVDTSNTVDGKPIYYWINRHNETVPLDASCVVIVNSTNIRLEDLTIKNCSFGITLAYSSKCTIENVTVTANEYGIMLDNSYLNLIINNKAISNSEGGICLVWSHHNLIINNVVMNNAGTLSIVGGAGGIYLEDTVGNTLIGNILVDNSQGVGVDDSTHIEIIGNNITNNFVRGIALLNAYSCLITENDLISNSVGIEVYFTSKRNRMYHNNFVNNSKQVTIQGPALVNEWNEPYPLGGNYWSNHNGTDIFSGRYQNETGMDGISDTPYVMDEYNHDKYPLMNPWCPTDISIVNVASSETEFYLGRTVNITVDVSNRGTISETFSVTCRYALEGTEYTLDTALIVDLPPNTVVTLTFNWTPIEPTTYLIKAEATTLPDEMNPSDNNLTSPFSVKVKMLCDVNGDGKIDITDIAIAALAYGSYPNHQRWNRQADINYDNKVDIQDLASIAQNFGKTS